jgi:general secretion pathway protein K
MRPSQDNRRGERGLALVMVLLVVTLLTILVLEFTYTVRVESHISRNSLNSLQATYLARSGINILAGALKDDDTPNVDPHGDDGWGYFAQGICQNILENEEALPPSWVLFGRIIDESGKINVNFTRPATLSPNPPEECVPNNATTHHLCWLDALERLAISLGVPDAVVEEMTIQLEDYWVQNAIQPASGPVRQPAPQFTSLEDVAAALPALRDRMIFDRLQEYVTAISGVAQAGASRRVNCNTAPREVLEAIMDDAQAADEVIAQRAESPFESAANCGAQGQGVQNMFNVSSNTFRIESVAVVNGVGRTIRALLRRQRAPQGGTQGLGGEGVSWSVTYLDWQKEGGASNACRSLEPEPFE